MILKFAKKNTFSLIAFTLINTLLLSIGLFFSAKIDIDDNNSFKHNINIGDIILIETNNNYDDIFNFELINTGICNGIKNPYTNFSNSLVLSTVPILFVNNDKLKDECIMDYETYIYNNCPEYVTITNKDYSSDRINIKVNQRIFSNNPGIYFSKASINSYIESITIYYAIIINDNNIEKINNAYMNKQNNHFICFQGDLVNYYDEKRKEESIHVKLSYIILLYIIFVSLISSYICYLYHKKNLNDYNLLYLLGESKNKIFLLSNTIVFLSILISFILSLILVNIFITINNIFNKNFLIMFGNRSLFFLINFIFFELLCNHIVSQISIKKIKGI